MWNTSYEFPLEEGEADPSLKIVVKDWDAAGRNGMQGRFLFLSLLLVFKSRLCKGSAVFYFARAEKDKPYQSTSTLTNNEKDVKVSKRRRRRKFSHFFV